MCDRNDSNIVFVDPKPPFFEDDNLYNDIIINSNSDERIIYKGKKRTYVKKEEINPKKRRKKKKNWRNRPGVVAPFKLENIEDLLYVAWNYQGDELNWYTLWSMIPALTELNKMIGMKSIKEKVIDLITFYTQNLHIHESPDSTSISNKDLMHCVIYGLPGTGKCLGKDTPIIMKNGSIKMVQDVNVGDEIMGDDSTPRKILSVTSGVDMLYRIDQSYGDSYVVNESHILSLKLSKSPFIRNRFNKSFYQVIWFDKVGTNSKIFSYKNKDQTQILKKAKDFTSTLPCKGSVIDISVLEYLKKNKSWKSAYKGYKVGVSYPHSNVPIDPYILGYWLGDDTSVKAEVTILDSEIAEVFQKAYPDIKITPNKSDISNNITSESGEYFNKSSKIFLTQLQELKLINNKFIPELYLLNSESVRKNLLAGLIDAKGHITNNTCYDIVQKNKNIARSIVNVSRSLGYKAIIKEVTKECYYKGNKIPGIYYRVIISGANDLPIKLERKKFKSYNKDKNPLVYQINVKQISEGKYYGFEIDGNKRFLLGDFTVTHNTTLVHILAKIYCKMGCLPTEKVTIVRKTDLMGKWTGHSEDKTRKKLESSLGGVLLIDEAYGIGGGDKEKIDTFSKGITNILNQFLTDHQGEFVCMIAGYEDRIQSEFFSANEGLKSRFGKVFRVENYSGEELYEMFSSKVIRDGWKVEKNSINSSFFVKNKEYFPAYGRDIDKFISIAKTKHSRRVFGVVNSKKKEINLEDLNKAFEHMKEGSKKENLPPMYI